MPDPEPHFKVSQIATQWQLSDDVVRRLFVDEPGVLKFGQHTRLAGRKYKRRYSYLRIPESAFLRVRENLMRKRAPVAIPLPPLLNRKRGAA